MKEKKQVEFEPVFVNLIPDLLEGEKLYISKKYGVAIHHCACGCHEIVVTPLGEGGWKLTENNGKVSLNPSIGNWSFSCKSHYFITDNIAKLL